MSCNQKRFKQFKQISMKKSFQFNLNVLILLSRTFLLNMESNGVQKIERVYSIVQLSKSYIFAIRVENRTNLKHMQHHQLLKHDLQPNYRNDKKILTITMHKTQQECPFPKHPDLNPTENDENFNFKLFEGIDQKSQSIYMFHRVHG